MLKSNETRIQLPPKLIKRSKQRMSDSWIIKNKIRIKLTKLYKEHIIFWQIENSLLAAATAITTSKNILRSILISDRNKIEIFRLIQIIKQATSQPF